MWSPQQPGNGWRRSFWALNITQFQGAFSANAFQNLLSYMVLGMGLTHEQRDKMVPLILLFFSVPLVLFSMAGGFLADRFSKRQVILGTKLVEIGAMAAGIIALGTGYFPLQLAVLFVVATQSALFGPSKYGLLPEILPEKWLSWGNGILELLTFLAIISGIVAAGLMSERFHGHEVYAFALCWCWPALVSSRSGDRKSSTRCAAEKISRQLCGRSYPASRPDAQRPDSLSGSPGQHLFLVHWNAFPANGVRLRKRYFSRPVASDSRCCKRRWQLE